MVRAAAKREVLAAIARHNGEWYWYQVDHAVIGRCLECVGPFFAEIDALVAEGMIEVRPAPDLAGGVRYWITEAGRVVAVE